MGENTIVLVVGDATPLVEAKVAEVINEVTPSLGPLAFNSSHYRGGESGLESALQTARTLPMMGERRLVVVHDAHNAGGAFWERLYAYVDSPSESTVLIVSANSLPKSEKGKPNFGIKVKNLLHKQGAYHNFRTADSDPVRFVLDRVRAANVEMTRSTAGLLVALSGGDLSRLTHEVDKLALFVGDAKKITESDVQTSVAALGKAEIWDLTTGIALKNKRDTLTCLNRLCRDGEDPRRLLAMILWQLRTLIVADDMAARGVPDDQIRKACRMRWNLFRTLRPTLGKGTLAPQAMLTRIASCNRQMNTRRSGAQRALESLVLELVSV